MRYRPAYIPLFFKVLLLLATSALISCQQENMGDCFKSSGSQTTEKRSVEPFTAIRLYDGINLNIEQDSELNLEVEAGENLMGSIITEVKDGTLIIENENRCNWVRSYKKEVNVNLSTPTLTDITYYGSGELRFKKQFSTPTFRLNCWEASGDLYLDLDCPDVEIKSHTGPTTIYCQGKGVYTVAYINGIGRLDMASFQANEVLAVNTNSGELKIRSDSLIMANIEGNGNIFYSGDAQVELKQSGKGELIKID